MIIGCIRTKFNCISIKGSIGQMATLLQINPLWTWHGECQWAISSEPINVDAFFYCVGSVCGSCTSSCSRWCILIEVAARWWFNALFGRTSVVKSTHWHSGTLQSFNFLLSLRTFEKYIRTMSKNLRRSAKNTLIDVTVHFYVQCSFNSYCFVCPIEVLKTFIII